MEKLLRVADVATILQVSKLTAWNYIRRGDLKSYRVGQQHRITREQLESFIKGEGVAE